ncbi:MAG: sigma factor-like helix-turn-helix DNA-binding protein [Planctomycetota bacterium]
MGKAPCTPQHLEKMPVFVSRHPAKLAPGDLHPAYRPDASVYELSLNGRAFKALESLGIRTIGDLLTTPRERLMDQWGFGPQSLSILHEEIRRFLLQPAQEAGRKMDLSSFTALVRSLIRMTSPEPRDKDVLEKRLGIGTDEIWSLGRLGEKYGLTRERIRQIEAANLEALALRTRREALADFWQTVLDIVTEAGRRCALDYVAGEMTHRLGWPRRPNRKALAKILNLHPELRADIRTGEVQRW